MRFLIEYSSIRTLYFTDELQGIQFYRKPKRFGSLQ